MVRSVQRAVRGSRTVGRVRRTSQNPIKTKFAEFPFPDVGGIACSGAGSLQAPQPQGVYEGLQVGDLQVGLGLRRRGRAEASLVARFPSSFGVVAFLYPRRIPRKAGGSKP